MRTADADEPGSHGPGVDVSLLPTKLTRPRLPPSYVPRPLVNKLLEAGAQRPLTVVSAGPGWGKTLTTAAWAASTEAARPTAWLSLDEGDNDPRLFWAYFIAALRQCVDLPSGNPMANLVPMSGDRSPFMQRLAMGLTELPQDVVVVLDDFHVIHEPAVLASLTELLRRRIDPLRVVLLTRGEAPLPLHRMEMDGELTEIRAHDLGFQPAEASVLFTGHGVPVSADEALLLVSRTEGWATGLRLAALFLRRQGTPQGVTDFAGDDRSVSRYLAEEVLGRQSDEMRQFLLRTSIADRMCSELAQVLTGQERAQQHLETLESSNAFVVGLGPGRQWFRYHALMREMLRHQLAVEQPQELTVLHREAAQWFAANGHLYEALRHAADAGDWPLLARLFVTKAVSLLVSVDRESVAQILLRVPPSRLADGPELALVAGARLFHAGQYDQIQPHLDFASAHLDDAAPESRLGVMVAQRLLATVVARSRGDMAALLSNATEVLDLVPADGDTLTEGSAIRAIAFGSVGLCRLWSAEVAEASDAFRRGLAAANGSIELTRVNLLAHLALAAAEEGRHRSATDYAKQALEVVELRGWGDLAQAAAAYLALSMVELQRDHLPEAQKLLAQGREAAAPERVPRLAFDLLQVRLDADRGRVDSARAGLLRVAAQLEDFRLPDLLVRWRAIAEAEVEMAAGNPVEALRILTTSKAPPSVAQQVCLARALLASGDAQGAEEVLAPLRDADLGEPVQLSDRAEMWTLTALAADARREDNRAIDATRRAVIASMATGIRRPMVRHHGTEVQRLLGRLKEIEPALAGTVDGLTAHLGSVDSSPQAVSAQLTDRELMILKCLPSMMTNAEIAAELFVSINTVKVHLKHIYRKLDVETRRQAVHRARELGLTAEPATPPTSD